MFAPLLLLALVQAPRQAPPSAPVAQVEVTPASPEIEVGASVQLTARALDPSGHPVADAAVEWFANGEGQVDSTGLVTGGYQGYIQVTAAARGKDGKPVFGFARVRVLPARAARVEIVPVAGPVLAGTRLTLRATAFSRHGDRRDETLAFSSGIPRVATVTPDGRLTAVAPGRVTITATAGGRRSGAKGTLALTVVPGAITKLSITPGEVTVRTGDVVRFSAGARAPTGRPVSGFAVRWGVAGGEGIAQVDDEGTFVAETPGRYTVIATAGTRTAEALVTVTPRRVMRGMEVLGRVPLPVPTAEAWVHPSGACAYVSTIADRVYVINVRDPRAPAIVDSMVTDARLVNDVMTTEDGRYGVFSRENASNRKNGIVVFDASDPCHPKPIAEYTETVSGGVHSSYVYQGRVYLTDDATGSMRVIDIRDPMHPKEVGRWQTDQTEAGRYLHDIMVADGLAYLAYWNDGLVILDVGNGMKGGSPEHPAFVSRLKYDLTALYARVDQLYGLGARGTHTAWRAGRYVFVGDEVYASSPTILGSGPDLTWGRLHVVDVSDIEHPREVAWYEPTDGGVHNVWVAGDTLYLGNYQGGARVLDISGELKGDLLRQGREISWVLTADSLGYKSRVPFTWGVVVHDGLMYVPDINSGLWIMRVEPRREAATP